MTRDAVPWVSLRALMMKTPTPPATRPDVVDDRHGPRGAAGVAAVLRALHRLPAPPARFHTSHEPTALAVAAATKVVEVVVLDRNGAVVRGPARCAPTVRRGVLELRARAFAGRAAKLARILRHCRPLVVRLHVVGDPDPAVVAAVLGTVDGTDAGTHRAVIVTGGSGGSGWFLVRGAKSLALP